MTAPARYAFFFAPRPGSALWLAGSAWLGRDAGGDDPLPRPVFDQVTPGETDALTKTPRHYGFHATLRAPFTPKAEVREKHIIAAADGVAGAVAPFSIALTTTQAPTSSIALSLAHPSPEMDALHTACLDAGEPLRAPLSSEDRERRLSAPLSARERAHLDQWGYPFVRDCFWFHMTLTGPVAMTRARVLEPLLAGYFSPCVSEPVTVDAVCVFYQPDRATPFSLIHRAPFVGAAP